MKGGWEHLIRVPVPFFWFVSRTPPLDHGGVGGKPTLVWILRRHQKGHILVLRLAFSSIKSPSSTQYTQACPCHKNISGPLQRSLSFKQPFPKITKVEGKKEPFMSQIKRHEMRYWRGESHQRACSCPSLSFNRRGN